MRVLCLLRSLSGRLRAACEILDIDMDGRGQKQNELTALMHWGETCTDQTMQWSNTVIRIHNTV